MVRAIDTFVNVNMGSVARPAWLVRVAEDYFNRADSIFKDIQVPELIEAMDRAGVEKCIISTSVEDLSDHALSFPKADPDRFVLSLSLDPRNGMTSIRGLQAISRDHPVVLARITPFMVGAIPPNEKEYYPVYAKCIEMDLAIAVNTGIPGPPMPGKCQDPMYLDEVCVFFPELKLIMAHGADPWWDVAIRLMIKYHNLYLQTSAYAPRYFPPQLIQFMNTRGQDKIMFASDHPVLSFERCVKEAQELDLREGVLDKFLYSNAHRLFWGDAAAAAK